MVMVTPVVVVWPFVKAVSFGLRWSWEAVSKSFDSQEWSWPGTLTVPVRVG